MSTCNTINKLQLVPRFLQDPIIRPGPDDLGATWEEYPFKQKVNFPYRSNAKTMNFESRSSGISIALTFSE
jgi:hypothetical protein